MVRPAELARYHCHCLSTQLPAAAGVFVGLLVGCLTSQQQASVSQGRICSDKFTCCHTETEVADPTFHLTRSQYTDTGPNSPSADPLSPGAWQGSHWSASFEVTGMTRPGKIPTQAGFEPGIFRCRGGRLNHLASEAVAAGEMSEAVPTTVGVNDTLIVMAMNDGYRHTDRDGNE